MSEQAEYDVHKWEMGINAAETDVYEINAFIKWKLDQYTKDKWRDDNMWEIYLEDFNIFIVNTFRSY